MFYTPGNALSILVFLGWIPIAIWGARRWPPAKAGMLLMLLPLMFLPELVTANLPGLPTLGKTDFAKLVLLIGVLLFHRERLTSVRLPRWSKLVILLLLGGTILTVFTNADPIPHPGTKLLGHRPFDAVTTVLEDLLDYVLPFVLGLALFRDVRDIRVLLASLVGATIIYGFFQLVEVRLSPQFNNWFYGYFQHSWEQMVRDGGFRPIVFMAHGLTVAMFTMTGILASAVLQKNKLPLLGKKAVWATSFLFVVLVLNKSVAALLYSIAGSLLIFFAKPRTQHRFTMVLAVIVLAYPSLRGADLIPVDAVAETMTEQFGEERGASLMVRITNEKTLLDRALERPLFGWGAYGRTFIYDPETGRPLSIPDGEWIVTLGKSGFVGFYSKFLLLLIPLFVASRQSKYLLNETHRRLLAGLALIVGFCAFDMVPNSDAYTLPFMYSGALLSASTAMMRYAARQRHRRRQALAQRRLGPSIGEVPA